MPAMTLLKVPQLERAVIDEAFEHFRERRQESAHKS